MSSSRKLVCQTLEFSDPCRIPRQLWLLPWANINYPAQVLAIQAEYPDDLMHAPQALRQRPQISGDPFTPGVYVDEWGCTFENKQHGIIGEVKQSLLKDCNDIAAIKPPQEFLSLDISEINAVCRKTDKFVLSGCCPRPFERLQFLRGTENVMVEMMTDPAAISAALAKIHQFYLKEVELWAKTEVDALFFMDDWGSQNSLLIPPKIWRDMFRPLYADYISIAHAHGKKAFMHSDGYILEIIPDLIELGLDALNCQIFCIGIDNLAKSFRHKITFWGEMDRQQLLPNAETSEIRHAVRTVYDRLYCGGGVIAQLEFSPGAKPDNVAATFDEWNRIHTQLYMGNPGKNS